MTPRFGLPSFRDLLERVAEYYREHEAALREQNEALMRAFADLKPPPAPQPMRSSPMRRCAARAARSLQTSMPATAASAARRSFRIRDLERLLRDWHARRAQRRTGPAGALHGDPHACDAWAKAASTISSAAASAATRVDEHWMIPHFEKMLYDNGSLLAVYAQAAVATGDAFYRQIAATPRTGRSARCNRRTAATTRATTPTPKATRANSMSGIAKRCAAR